MEVNQNNQFMEDKMIFIIELASLILAVLAFLLTGSFEVAVLVGYGHLLSVKFSRGLKTLEGILKELQYENAKTGN